MDSNDRARHFACTGCGKCCDRGPEMSLGEATALADKFVLRLIFKLHSLPVTAREPWAVDWWKRQGSTLPIRQCLDEKARHLALFSSVQGIDKIVGAERSNYLEISCISIHIDRGKCPALKENICSIYDARPLTCRSVPFHYSRTPSTLPKYLDKFAATTGYQCDTSPDAPMVFKDGGVVDGVMDRARADAIEISHTEKAWKEAIAALVHGSDADKGGFPSYKDIVCNSQTGATSVSMKTAWRVAVQLGILTEAQFMAICQKQINLLKVEIAKATNSLQITSPQEIKVFRDMLEDYEKVWPKMGWRSKLLRKLSR